MYPGRRWALPGACTDQGALRRQPGSWCLAELALFLEQLSSERRFSGHLWVAVASVVRVTRTGDSRRSW